MSNLNVGSNSLRDSVLACCTLNVAVRTNEGISYVRGPGLSYKQRLSEIRIGSVVGPHSMASPYCYGSSNVLRLLYLYPSRARIPFITLTL